MNMFEFWQEFPKRFNDKDFLRQVGKTSKGQPITQTQLSTIILDIEQKLNLCQEDIVMDLCCGNGLITKKIAQKCKHISAIDFSEPLIEIAKLNHSSNNIKYFLKSALDIDETIKINEQQFTKIYMYEALQNFREEDLLSILKKIISLSKENVKIFIDSILDIEKMWLYYNTDELKNDYYNRLQNGEPTLGTWWDKIFIANLCKSMNLQCIFFDQNIDLITAYYRFDILIFKL